MRGLRKSAVPEVATSNIAVADHKVTVSLCRVKSSEDSPPQLIYTDLITHSCSLNFMTSVTSLKTCTVEITAAQVS